MSPSDQPSHRDHDDASAVGADPADDHATRRDALLHRLTLARRRRRLSPPSSGTPVAAE